MAMTQLGLSYKDVVNVGPVTTAIMLLICVPSYGSAKIGISIFLRRTGIATRVGSGNDSCTSDINLVDF